MRFQILKNYYDDPVLKHIIQLTSGDEGFPRPILIDRADYHFRLYATMVCFY